MMISILYSCLRTTIRSKQQNYGFFTNFLVPTSRNIFLAIHFRKIRCLLEAYYFTNISLRVRHNIILYTPTAAHPYMYQ